MTPLFLLALALGALLLPWPWGLTAPLLAWLARTGRAACAGVLLLSLSSVISPEALTPGAKPAPHRAVRLTGRWRTPPASPAHLETEAGDVILTLASDLRPPRPGDSLDLLARLNDRGQATAVHITSAGDVQGAWPERLASRAAARIRKLVPGDAGGLVRSLLLGDRGDLDGATVAAFRSTGLAHLLSLSGLHVSLLATMAGRVAGPAVVTAWLLGFTWLAGPRAPLLRALMGRGLGVLFHRRARAVDPLAQLLLVAVLLAVLLGPAFLSSLSARLSFLAVGGLVGGARLLPWNAAALLLGPAGAVLATAPLCVEHFGRVAPVGILLTPLLAPAVAAILAVGSVAVLPGDTFAALDPLLQPLLRGVSELLMSAVHIAAELAPAPLRPAPPPWDPTLMGLAVVAALAVLARGARSHLASSA
jgi:ComEC/Rec2-related protein